MSSKRKNLSFDLTKPTKTFKRGKQIYSFLSRRIMTTYFLDDPKEILQNNHLTDYFDGEIVGINDDKTFLEKFRYPETIINYYDVAFTGKDDKLSLKCDLFDVSINNNKKRVILKNGTRINFFLLNFIEGEIMISIPLDKEEEDEKEPQENEEGQTKDYVVNELYHFKLAMYLDNNPLDKNHSMNQNPMIIEDGINHFATTTSANAGMFSLYNMYVKFSWDKKYYNEREKEYFLSRGETYLHRGLRTLERFQSPRKWNSFHLEIGGNTISIQTENMDGTLWKPFCGLNIGDFVTWTYY